MVRLSSLSMGEGCSLGKTLAESMACGIPVVCFDATGPKDIVSHKVDDYKAVPFHPSSLARGIEWVLNAPNYDELCCNAREKDLESLVVMLSRKSIQICIKRF